MTRKAPPASARSSWGDPASLNASDRSTIPLKNPPPKPPAHPPAPDATAQSTPSLCTRRRPRILIQALDVRNTELVWAGTPQMNTRHSPSRTQSASPRPGSASPRPPRLLAHPHSALAPRSRPALQPPTRHRATGRACGAGMRRRNWARCGGEGGGRGAGTMRGGCSS